MRNTASAPIPLDDEQLGELMGRPFYEVELTCTLNVVTGDVTIESARRAG